MFYHHLVTLTIVGVWAVISKIPTTLLMLCVDCVARLNRTEKQTSVLACGINTFLLQTSLPRLPATSQGVLVTFLIAFSFFLLLSLCFIGVFFFKHPDHGIFIFQFTVLKRAHQGGIQVKLVSVYFLILF